MGIKINSDILVQCREQLNLSIEEVQGKVKSIEKIEKKSTFTQL